MSKRSCFIFQLISRIFSCILAGQRAQRPISLPPVKAPVISSIAFFDDTFLTFFCYCTTGWKLGLFSLLRRSKSVTTSDVPRVSRARGQSQYWRPPTQPFRGSIDAKSEFGVKRRRKLTCAQHIVVYRPAWNLPMTVTSPIWRQETVVELRI